MSVTTGGPTGSVVVEDHKTLVHTEGFDPNEDVHIQIDYIANDGSQLMGVGGHNTCDADGTQDYEIPMGSVEASQYSLSHKPYAFARAKVWSENWSGRTA